MKAAKILGLGALVMCLAAGSAWLFLALQSDIPSAARAEDVALLRQQVVALLKEVELLKNQALPATATAPASLAVPEVVREVAVEPPTAGASGTEGDADKRARELMALFWRHLREDPDGIVALLTERGCTPFDAAVLPAVEEVAAQLDDLCARVPVNLEAYRIRKDLVERIAAQLEDPNAQLSSRDRASMTTQLDDMRRRQAAVADQVRQFEEERAAILKSFLTRLPPKVTR